MSEAPSPSSASSAIRLDPTRLDRLVAADVLAPRHLLEARQRCRDPQSWRDWAGAALLVLAVGHILAAIICFFAFNWAALSGATKIGNVGGLLLLALGSFLLARPASVLAQACGVAGTLLTGVLFAVIGQVYQTGADHWLLFVPWAVLTLPFALVARNAIHMALWLVIAQTGWLTFGFQYAVPMGWLPPEAVAVLAGMTLLLVLGARELLVERFRQYWLDHSWTRVLPALAALIQLGIIAMSAIAELEHAEPWELIGAGICVLAAGLLVLRHQCRRDGFAVAALAGAGLALLAGTLAGRLIFDRFRHDLDDAVGPLLLLTLICLALIGGYAHWLRQRWQELPVDTGEHAP